jgi:hypothetical protein
MRRPLPLAALVAGLLACTPTALAIQGGHNAPTNKIEGAFKIALLQRKTEPGGCYAAPARVAAEVRRKSSIKAGVAPGFGGVNRMNVVYVIKRGTSCDRLVMALRASQGLYVLDSAVGPVRLQGNRGLSEELRRAGRGPLRSLAEASKTFRISNPDAPERLEVICPRGKYPLGGGMVSNPPVGADGEGAYPHSYERLGVQRGFHISAFLLDPSPANTAAREVTIQVVCGLGLVPTAAPHRTVFIRPGQTKTATARCPGGTKLFSGGFQRTDFRSPNGSYVTESRAVGTKAWRVSGSAFGTIGGELTAIAHCARDKSLPITEVSASVPLAAGASATATTPPCPPGRRLTSGGFSGNGSQGIFFADGGFNRNGTWSATAFGYFGPAPSLTAYGYCLRAK